jgi:F-box-like
MACQSSARTPSIAILRRQVPPQHSLSMAAFALTLDLHDLPFNISTDRVQDINCRTSAQRVHDTRRGANARTVSCAESVKGCWASVTAQQLATLPTAAANLLVTVRGHHILSSRTAACHGLYRLSAAALLRWLACQKGRGNFRRRHNSILLALTCRAARLLLTTPTSQRPRRARRQQLATLVQTMMLPLLKTGAVAWDERMRDDCCFWRLLLQAPCAEAPCCSRYACCASRSMTNPACLGCIGGRCDPVAPLLQCRRIQSCRACLVVTWDLRAGRQPLEMAQQHPVQALEQRDIVDAVFSKLDGVTLARSSCVCKLWNEAARLDRLWQTAYESAAQDAFQRNTELQLPALLQGLYLLQRHQHVASDVNTVS